MQGFYITSDNNTATKISADKNVIFVFRKAKTEEDVSTQQTIFHNLITKGLKWTETDVAILSCSPGSLRWKDVVTQCSPELCVLFGVEAQEFGILLQLEDHKPQLFKNTYFLKTKSIDDLEKQIPLKKKFWELLQNLLKEKGLV